MNDLDLFSPDVREAIEQFDCVTMHGEKWRLLRAELVALARVARGKQPVYRAGPTLQSRLLDSAQLTALQPWLRALLNEAADALDGDVDAQRYRFLRELDGGAVYHLVGDCDGIHADQMDAAIDAAMLGARP